MNKNECVKIEKVKVGKSTFVEISEAEGPIRPSSVRSGTSLARKKPKKRDG
jgi:hypothetical protein